MKHLVVNDSDGHISGVQVTPSGATTAPPTVVSNISYRPFGPIGSYTLGNGQTIVRTYDANYRLTDLTSPALNLHFARDAMGDIVALGNAAGANPATETYSYDPLYRLTGITDAGTALESYTYNQTGDRLSKTAPGLATGAYLYTTGTHQLSSIGNAPQANDADGNTTGSVIAGNTYGFGYNGRNRMTVVQLNGQTVGNYTYNAMGMRIGKVGTVPQATIERYAYDEGGHLLGEYGTTSRDYVWLGEIPVAVMDNTVSGNVTASTVNFVTADQLGTPRAVSNSTGTVIWQLTYQGNPFGEQKPTSTTGYVLNLRLPGQYYDAESGLSNWGFRSYEAATGRSPQSDPMGVYGGQWSTYAYVGSDPLRNVDPYGLASQLTVGVGGAFIGLVTGDSASVNVGFNLDWWNSSVYVQDQVNLGGPGTASGAFGGWGGMLSYTPNSAAPASGFSSAPYFEADAGWGPSGGVSGTKDPCGHIDWSLIRGLKGGPGVGAGAFTGTSYTATGVSPSARTMISILKSQFTDSGI